MNVANPQDQKRSYYQQTDAGNVLIPHRQQGHDGRCKHPKGADDNGYAHVVSVWVMIVVRLSLEFGGAMAVSG